MRSLGSTLLAVTTAIAILACTDKRVLSTTSLPQTTWKVEVGPVVVARCATAACHAGLAPAGSYDLTTYTAALGVGTDAYANAVAGDPNSLILTELAQPSHAQVASLAPLLRAWIVDSQLAYERSRIHGGGLLDPASDEFHGSVLRGLSWQYAQCQRCHGADFAGTASAPSCLTCHAQGPTACDTCHGQPPSSGAHATHFARGFACAECHVVPTSWDTPGHILDAQGNAIDAPAQIAFGALANLDVTPPHRTSPASYDASTKTCTAVYCHGAVLGDSAASSTSPTWNGGAAAAACGTCHGKPPADHAQSECAVCHPGAGEGTPAHVDGKLQVGDGVLGGATITCTGCHGSGSQPAPPRGLHGEQATTTLAVGAHRAHLDGGSLRGPIACTECHVVPAALSDPGHIDSALPAEVAFGPLAQTDGATPTWDRTTATCASVYCHGGGAHLAADPGRGLAAPTWTAGPSQAYCGTCHSLPPSDSFHASTLTLNNCVTCHPGTVDGFGNILITGSGSAATSKHINGVVDFQ